MKPTNMIIAVVLLISGHLIAQPAPDFTIEGHGDLYVLHNTDNTVRVIAARNNGNVLDTTLVQLPENLKFHYFAAAPDSGIDFEFQLHKRIKHSWRQEKPEKTLVVADLHGQLDAFVAFLKGNGVVNDNLEWVYGKNQLLILGDILDRGRNDNGIMWLVYKLEKEAEDAGGRLDFILGNHEDLVLRDDIRYVHEEHLIFAAKAGIPYADLYASHSELGRWIRDSYLILVVGDNLFVHAGLHPKITEKKYKIGEINELGWRFIGIPTEAKKELHRRNELLFGDSGPLWYRGLASDAERHSPLKSEDLDKVLEYYDAARIIVGHTEVDEVDWRYNGRVIAVNVRHYRNFGKHRTAGLLIEGDNYFTVNYTGDKVKLNK
ncbi:metallophosphoesterase [Proteiniphilum sp. X52]|uniref:metallophosphoesterase n=1 Tax=Proteiniphilum sp. X52 TaxID=2382159 RepID=UPI001314E580|nr:metallophosphoesterase [Proteiniphilum sp. X52]